MDNKETMDNEEAIQDLAEIKFRRIYDYLPYSHWRIKGILKQCGCHLENIWAGYKGNRYPGYVEHYRIINSITGEVINKDITMDSLRHFFARRNYPLHDEKSSCQQKRNPGAQTFIDTLDKLSNER